MRKLLILAGALTILAAASVAQAAPKFDLVAGSGVWSGGSFGTPTVHVNANERNPEASKFTFEYAEGYVVQGKIVGFEVTGNTACLVGQVTKEKGQDPASPGNQRFDVSEYAPIAISKVGADYFFNYGVSQESRPGLCSIGANLSFDPGTADFAIFDAD
jgi:opacity protein-like surface antigen